MGTSGLAVTGGVFFNDLSDTDGSLALANEGPSLDSCCGHSAPSSTSEGRLDVKSLFCVKVLKKKLSCRYKRQTYSSGQYHYHANINCTDAGSATGANDPDVCKLIGYYADGVPVYGFCKDSSGKI